MEWDVLTKITWVTVRGKVVYLSLVQSGKTGHQRITKMRKKKEKNVVYVCGLPHCHCRLTLPDRGEAVKLPHRDLSGFRCNGIMVRWDLTKEGREHNLRMLATVRARALAEKKKRPDPKSDRWKWRRR